MVYSSDRFAELIQSFFSVKMSIPTKLSRIELVRPFKRSKSDRVFMFLFKSSSISRFNFVESLCHVLIRFQIERSILMDGCVNRYLEVQFSLSANIFCVVAFYLMNWVLIIFLLGFSKNFLIFISRLNSDYTFVFD